MRGKAEHPGDNGDEKEMHKSKMLTEEERRELTVFQEPSEFLVAIFFQS